MKNKARLTIKVDSREKMQGEKITGIQKLGLGLTENQLSKILENKEREKRFLESFNNRTSSIIPPTAGYVPIIPPIEEVISDEEIERLNKEDEKAVIEKIQVALSEKSLSDKKNDKVKQPDKSTLWRQKISYNQNRKEELKKHLNEADKMELIKLPDDFNIDLFFGEGEMISAKIRESKINFLGSLVDFTAFIEILEDEFHMRIEPIQAQTIFSIKGNKLNTNSWGNYRIPLDSKRYRKEKDTQKRNRVNEKKDKWKDRLTLTNYSNF